MKRYACVAVNVPRVSGLFDYAVPEFLAGNVQPGSLVVVPFGRQTVQGVVVRGMDETDILEVKNILALVDERPVMNTWQIELAQRLASGSLQPLQTCLDLFLPPGLFQQADTLYHLTFQNTTNFSKPHSLKERIVSVLEKRGDLRGRQLEHTFAHVDWKASMQALIREGVVISRPVLPPPTVHPKTIRTARLSMAIEQARVKLTDLTRTGAVLERRLRAIEFLHAEAVDVNVAWVYANSGCDLQDLKRMAEEELVILGEREVIRDPLGSLPFDPSIPPELTEDQSEAWKSIRKALNASANGISPRPHILHGVTGSGKTEIYLRAVAEVIESGRQAIVLVPEIALTPQTVRRFAGRFPGQVGLIHSRLSVGERYDTWRRIRDGQIAVVVGPRSALFSPVPDPGLIVLDECHDGSYFQEDMLPPYSTADLARQAAELTHSLVLYGSASPSVEMLHQANQEGWERLELPLRILAHKNVLENLKTISERGEDGADRVSLPLPNVKVVDMREELKNNNRSILSVELQDALKEVVRKKQQAILFLNRRGSSTYVFCRACGFVLECPRCGIPLTWHEGAGALRCHQCTYVRKMPARCPACESDQIRQYGTGTERVEKVVNELLPYATTLRWDAESTRGKGTHEIILSHFINHRADILIGTQMLAKGLDLPLVTLVGVILADVGLFLPDFRAAERTFQVLMQVSGRAGRSALGGRVILQTFHPEHYAIGAAVRHDYAGFFREEIEKRKAMVYPPFTRMVKMEIRSSDQVALKQIAEAMRVELQNRIEGEDIREVSLIGPAPCFYAKRAGLYRWQIILRGRDPLRLLRGVTLGEWRVIPDPQDLL